MATDNRSIFLAADAFGHKFNFRFERQRNSHKTLVGLVSTICMMLTLLPYSVYRISVMLDFGDSTILEINNPEYFNETFEVSTSKHGFNVAFGLVGWGDSVHDGDISTYGELKAFYKRWGNEGDPAGTNYFEIKTRPCTREELGLGNDPDESRFYPITGFSAAYLQDYWEILQCFDDDLVIRGSF